MSKKSIAKSILRELQYMNLSETKKDFIEKICNKIINDELAEVVRCKDCKYRIDDRCYASNLSNLAKYSHIKLGILTGDAYFCADGERKEE